MENQSQIVSTTILGIDPGYDRLGWAVATRYNDSWEQVNLGCIQTDRQQDVLLRYQDLTQQLTTLIDEFLPSQVAIETLFFANNTTTALKIAEVRGIVITLCLQRQIQISQYNPMTVKQAVTGNGKADKKAIAKIIELEFKLTNQPQLDDASDALALVLTHYLYGRYQRVLA